MDVQDVIPYVVHLRLLENKTAMACGNLNRYARIDEALWCQLANIVRWRSRTTLHWAAYTNNVERIRFLVRMGADVEVDGPTCDSFYWEGNRCNALSYAIQTQSVDAVRELVAYGAKLNSGDLHWAIDRKLYNVVELLDIDEVKETVSRDGRTALMLAAVRPGMVPLILAAGADIDNRLTGTTALIFAVKSFITSQKQFIMDNIKLLLEAGADTNIVDIHSDKTILELCKEFDEYAGPHTNRMPEIIGLLETYGAI